MSFQGSRILTLPINKLVSWDTHCANWVVNARMPWCQSPVKDEGWYRSSGISITQLQIKRNVQDPGAINSCAHTPNPPIKKVIWGAFPNLSPPIRPSLPSQPFAAFHTSFSTLAKLCSRFGSWYINKYIYICIYKYICWNSRCVGVCVCTSCFWANLFNNSKCLPERIYGISHLSPFFRLSWLKPFEAVYSLYPCWFCIEWIYTKTSGSTYQMQSMRILRSIFLAMKNVCFIHQKGKTNHIKNWGI